MKFPVFALLCALSLSACAQSTPAATDKAAAAGDKAPGAPAPARPADAAKDAMVRAKLKELDARLVPDRVAPAAIAGFQEAIVNGQTLYFSDDGRYMLQGSVYDLKEKRDIGRDGLSALRREELAKIPVSDRIVFAPVGPAKHTVAVFTDIECGYCRKLHSQIAQYNKLGIAVQYLAFPRAGLGSPDALVMESVWCSDDRRKALTDAKNGQSIAPKRCDNPVATEYKLGQRLGLQGTPMIVDIDGEVLPGYMDPPAMLEALDKLAAERTKGSGTPAGGR